MSAVGALAHLVEVMAIERPVNVCVCRSLVVDRLVPDLEGVQPTEWQKPYFVQIRIRASGRL